MMDWLTAIGAFAVGAVLAFVNSRISKSALKRGSGQLAGAFMARQIINVGYLFALFLLGVKSELGLSALLIGGALGVTLPSFLFTVMMLRTREPGGDEKENPNG